MRTDKLLRLLELFKGKTILFVLYEDIFQTLYHSEQVVTEFFIESGILRFKLPHLATRNYRISIIADILLKASEKERIAMIESATTLEDAFEIAKGDLSEDVQVALELAKERFKPTPFEQNESLRRLISTKLSTKHADLSVERVLRHLCVNTIGTEQIVYTLNTDDFVALCNKIDKSIEKIAKAKEIF